MDEYGEITKDTIRLDSREYTTAQTRDAQNAAQLFVCLMNSLTEEATQVVTLDHSEYTVGTFQDRPLFLKHIISKSHIKANATVSTVRMRLDSLDKYMEKIDSNIKEFNHYVKEQLDALSARRHILDEKELLFNIIKGYMAADDKDFRNYIMRKQQDYDEGDDITPARLMELAENMYNKAQEQEKWRMQTDEQKRIVALTAKVEGLEKSNKALKKKMKGKGRNSTESSTTHTTDETGKQSKKDKKKTVPKWKLIKPTDGKTTMTRNGKTYYWCNNHNMWCVHKPSECNLNKKSDEDKDNNNQSLRVAKSLTAIIDEEDEE